MDERQPFDLESHGRRSTHGPCFICEMLRGNPEYIHHVVAEDADHVAFLSKYPTLRGYCLVAPKRHIEDLAEDLSPMAYLELQALVHRLSRALKRVFEAERIYVLSLGSRQANSHIHFHVAPLPAGIPLAKQQYHALMAEEGILRLDATEMEQMAQTIRTALAAQP
jgi:diadenosine tetraphosphate (Ap4A) HIT family hydrolase